MTLELGTARTMRLCQKRGLHMQTNNELPIVCDLSVFTAEQRAAHLNLTRRVFIDWASRHETLDDGIAIIIEGNEERFLEVARWASEEHQCCAWLTFSVAIHPFATGTNGRIELRLTSSSDQGMAFIGGALGQMLAAEPASGEQRKAG